MKKSSAGQSTAAQTPSSVGDVLRRAMIERGFTGRALAAEAGVSEPTLSQVLNGRVDLSLRMAVALAARLGLDPYGLIELQARRQLYEYLQAAAGECAVGAADTALRKRNPRRRVRGRRIAAPA